MMGGYDRRSSKDDLCIDGRCKNHPWHRQSPGVCSLCLNEKLFQLQRTLSSHPPRGYGSSVGPRASSISSSLTSFYSCSSATLTSSPGSNQHGWDRRVPEAKGREPRSRLALFRFSGKNRTKASSDTGAGADHQNYDDDGKKRGRCWWK